MANETLILHAGLADKSRKNRWPARLGLLQSSTGLFLVLFMWLHIGFVASILLGKSAMWTITKLFEGYFFFGKSVIRGWCLVSLVSWRWCLLRTHSWQCASSCVERWRRKGLAANPHLPAGMMKNG